MEEQDLKFFKMAIASTLGVLILLLITTITIAFVSVDSEDDQEYQRTTTNTYAIAPAKTEWTPLDSSRYEKKEQQYPSQENINVPPCADPCKVRIEYSDKYFLPYPTYRYNDQYYYEDYPIYSRYQAPHYPNNQRFFHHRIIQSDYTY